MDDYVTIPQSLKQVIDNIYHFKNNITRHLVTDNTIVVKY